MANPLARIRFIVPGIPVAQPRQRHRIVECEGIPDYVRNYTPDRDPVNAYKAAIKIAAAAVYRGPPVVDPLRVDVLFLLPRTKGQIWKRKPMPRLPHAKKPDLDNLDKAVLDALTGLLWVDDKQVCDGRITKLIAAGDEQPHTIITVTPFTPEENNAEEESCEQKTLDW